AALVRRGCRTSQREELTMRFMMLMYPGPAAETTAIPGDESIARMMAYNEELTKAGVLLALDGLHPSATGARIRVVDGVKAIVDGPFSEAKELIGGYWLIQVRSREEALAWASRIPLGNSEMVEIRQVYELSELSAEAQRLSAPVADALGRA
ncbi:MAG: YciI family protein, partial [Kofleriaceae bacterium]